MRGMVRNNWFKTLHWLQRLLRINNHNFGIFRIIFIWKCYSNIARNFLKNITVKAINGDKNFIINLWAMKTFSQRKGMRISYYSICFKTRKDFLENSFLHLPDNIKVPVSYKTKRSRPLASGKISWQNSYFL